MPAPLLKLTNIGKSFGPTDVLMDVSLEVDAGQTLCPLGDNGAGKSTLIKILSGFHTPTTGTVKTNGDPVSFKSPKDAAGYGIATAHQFGGTFPLMTVGRSFFVGAEPTRWFPPSRRMNTNLANEIAVREIQSLGITRVTDGNRLVGALSGGERQAVAIARAVYFSTKMLILDEPTATLGVKEAANVLRIVMQARKKSIAVILVTHNVMHAMTVGYHFTLLIHGALAADFRKGERTREEITDLMAGGEAMAELAEFEGVAP